MVFGRLWLSLLLFHVVLYCNHVASGFRMPPPSRLAVHMRPHQNLQMNFIDRFFRVLTSNINSILRRLEDPEKVIEQAVIDMQNDLIRVRQSYAEISATLRRMEKQREQAVANAGEWYQRAQLALEKGDESLAREALSRRQIQLEKAATLENTLATQNAAVGRLYSSMMALEAKIGEAKRQKESMIARARTAKTSVNVNDMLSSLGDSSSTEAFERMKEKVESLEIQAEVAGELSASAVGTSANLERRFQELEGDSRVEDELNRLRKQLPRNSAGVPFAQLPASIERDMEYEKLKREMGR